MKTADLIGPALDWAVAKCEGGEGLWYDTVATYWIKIDGKDRALSKGWAQSFTPSTDPAQAYPIIEFQGISIIRLDDDYGTDSKGFCNNKRIPVWAAEHGGQHSPQSSYEGEHYPPQYEISVSECQHGPTLLIAAMRCYVARKLGDEIEIPKELLQ